MHPIHVLLLLLALRQGLIFRQLVYILQDQLFLLLQKIFQHVVDLLAVENRVVFLRIVQDSDQPVQMVVEQSLLRDLFSHPSHSYRVLVEQLFIIFALSVSVELAIEF